MLDTCGDKDDSERRVWTDRMATGASYTFARPWTRSTLQTLLRYTISANNIGLRPGALFYALSDNPVIW